MTRLGTVEAWLAGRPEKMLKPAPSKEERNNDTILVS